MSLVRTVRWREGFRAREIALPPPLPWIRPPDEYQGVKLAPAIPRWLQEESSTAWRGRACQSIFKFDNISWTIDNEDVDIILYLCMWEERHEWLRIIQLLDYTTELRRCCRPDMEHHITSTRPNWTGCPRLLCLAALIQLIWGCRRCRWLVLSPLSWDSCFSTHCTVSRGSIGSPWKLEAAWSSRGWSPHRQLTPRSHQPTPQFWCGTVVQ